MVIEFFGLPGAGKSTHARRLLRSLEPRGGMVLDRDGALRECLQKKDYGKFRNLFKRLPDGLRETVLGMPTALPEFHRFAMAHPALFHLVFEILAREGLPAHAREGVLYAFLLQAVQHQLFEEWLHPGRRLVVEEGFVQRGFTLLGYLPDRLRGVNDVNRYVSGIPRPDIAIWIDVDAETAMRRLSLRPDLPVLLQDHRPEERLRQLSAGRAVLAELSAALEKAENQGRSRS